MKRRCCASATPISVLLTGIRACRICRLSNQRICYREAQIRPAHAEARRRGESAGLARSATPVAGNERFTCGTVRARHAVPRPAAGNRRLAQHGNPDYSRQNASTSALIRVLFQHAGPARAGSGHGDARRSGTVRARHAVPRPAAGNGRLAQHGEAAPLGARHAVPRPATGNRRFVRHGRPRLFQTNLHPR